MKKYALTYFIAIIIVLSSINMVNNDIFANFEKGETIISSNIINPVQNPIQTNAIVEDGILSPGEYDYDSNVRWGSYYFSYSIIGDTLHMALKFRGLGWISIGISWYSSTYPMKDFDTYTGYVDDNGVTYFDDYWSTGDPGPAGVAVPDYDAQQDVLSFNGTQDATYTTIEWTRKLNTFDTTQDNEIVPGAQVIVMVAYHTTVDNPGWIHDNRRDFIFYFYGNPSAPRNLAASYQESRVDLTWDAPSGNGGTALTDYKIYRSFNGGSYQLLTTISNTATTSYTDLTVLNGENYTYAVTASNSAIGHKESGYSNKISVIPMGPLLNPTNLAAQVSSNNVTLTWDYPTSDGGIPVNDFKIYRSQDIGGPYTLIGLNSSWLTYNDYDIINAYTYHYYVLAEHDFLTSSASNTVSVNPVGPPTNPLDFLADYADNLVILSWTVPLSDGGFPITSYNIYRADTVDGTYALVGSSGNNKYNDSTALNGETYYYKVTTVNSAGESDFSDIQQITLALVPTTPSNFVTTAGDGYIYLSWDASDPKGYTLDFYTVYRSDGLYNPFTAIATTSDLFYNDSSVQNSKTYYYKITANNTIGESSYSLTKSATPASKPGAPSNVNLKNVATGVKITWNKPSKNGGYFISYYTIERSVDGAAFTDYADSQSKEFVDTSITFGLTHTYRIIAHNIIGSSGYSEEASIVPGVKPGKPGNVKAQVVSGDVKLTWDKPTDGGAQISSYNIYRSVDTNTSYTFIGVSKTTSYFDDTNTTKMYYYKVSAVNELGESDISFEVSIIPATVASSPVNLVGISGNEEAFLIWSEPENDGGLVVTSYKVYMSKTSNDTDFVELDTSTSLLFSVSGLENNQSYFFYVTAINEIGESTASNVIEVIPKAGYVDPSLIENANSDNNNDTNASSLNYEQIAQAAMVMFGIGISAVSIFVIRMFVQNKLKKN